MIGIISGVKVSPGQQKRAIFKGRYRRFAVAGILWRNRGDKISVRIIVLTLRKARIPVCPVTAAWKKEA